jgi:hypothetical protein
VVSAAGGKRVGSRMLVRYRFGVEGR